MFNFDQVGSNPISGCRGHARVTGSPALFPFSTSCLLLPSLLPLLSPSSSSSLLLSSPLFFGVLFVGVLLFCWCSSPLLQLIFFSLLHLPFFSSTSFERCDVGCMCMRIPFSSFPFLLLLLPSFPPVLLSSFFFPPFLLLAPCSFSFFPSSSLLSSFFFFFFFFATSTVRRGGLKEAKEENKKGKKEEGKERDKGESGGKKERPRGGVWGRSPRSQTVHHGEEENKREKGFIIINPRRNACPWTRSVSEELKPLGKLWPLPVLGNLEDKREHSGHNGHTNTYERRRQGSVMQPPPHFQRPHHAKRGRTQNEGPKRGRETQKRARYGIRTKRWRRRGGGV